MKMDEIHSKRRIVIQTAKELAAADWDEGTHSERFRKFWPDVHQFIRRNWPTYIEMARTILTGMLRPEYKGVSDKQKEEIFEALQADSKASARRNLNVKVGRGLLTLRPDQPGSREQHLFWKNTETATRVYAFTGKG